MRRVIIPQAFIILSLFMAQGAAAQPDLSGYWMISFGPIPPNREATPLEQSLLDLLPDDTLLLADSGLKEFPPGDFGGLKVTEAARAEAATYDIEVQRQVATTCQPPSIIYSMQGPFPMEIFQGRDIIAIKMEYFDVVRLIFMNQTEHPKDWPHSITGHSIGHWEKEPSAGGWTLVVDTAYLSAATFLNNGLNHSENMKLLERFRLSEDGQTLVIITLGALQSCSDAGSSQTGSEQVRGDQVTREEYGAVLTRLKALEDGEWLIASRTVDYDMLRSASPRDQEN